MELTLLAILVYTPFLQPIFNTAPLGLQEWVYVFAWTPVILVVDEVTKAILRWREHRANATVASTGGGG